MSQPSRAVLAFCLANNIPHEVKQVRIGKGENTTEEFLRINPYGTVPAIQHGDMYLAESHAILAYLATVYPVAANWYPTDPKIRANIDSYLHWHHNNTRFGLAGFIFRKYFLPMMTGKRTLSPELEKELIIAQKRALTIINETLNTWKYIGKTNDPSIADLILYCECTQMRAIKYDYSPYPNLVRLMNEMERIPAVVKAHEVFNKLIPRMKL